MDGKKNNFNVDALITKALVPKDDATIADLFQRRVEDLQISLTSAADVIGISFRSLKGILDGTQKNIDITNLFKIADFLRVPIDQLVKLYISQIEESISNTESIPPEEIAFLKQNFDLVAFRKSGLIPNTTDFKLIRDKILLTYGLKNLFDYVPPSIDVAFSAGITTPKNELARINWIAAIKEIFEKIDNPYEYDRKGLISYFPEIRWHSMNVEKGLIEVIRDLYRLGVTVVYQERLQGINKLNGATFQVNEKPCIALSNFAGFYPTLWFSLIHELFHVLFDWDEILTNQYHLSYSENEILSVAEKEKEADAFAREYLFSEKKTMEVKSYMNNPSYIQSFAKINNVHKSFIYVFYAYDTKGGNGINWARAKANNPDFSNLINTLKNPWENRVGVSDFVKYLKKQIYHC